MGLFDSKSKSKSKTIPYDPGQLKEIVSRIGQLGRTPMEMYPEQMYAEMTPQQREALEMREDFAGEMGGMVDPAMAAWQSMLSAPDAANNPYVKAMIDQQATTLNRNLEENLLPGIRARSGNLNERLGGTGYQVAEGIATRGTQEELADQMAKTQLSAYGQGLGQQRYGLSAAPGTAAFAMTPANILSGVGQELRGEEQMDINEAMQRFNFAQQEPWQRTQNQLNMFNAATLPYASTESKSKSTQSPFSSAMQLGSLAMGGFNMFGGGGGGAPPATVPATTGVMPMPAPQPAAMPGMMNMYGMGAAGPQMGGYWPMQRNY